MRDGRGKYQGKILGLCPANERLHYKVNMTAGNEDVEVKQAPFQYDDSLCRLRGFHHKVQMPHNCLIFVNAELHAVYSIRGDFRFVSSQWETALLSNAISHWLGASLESALQYYCREVS